MPDDKRRLYARQREETFIAASPYKPQIMNAEFAKAFIRQLLPAIRPYDADGAQKNPAKDVLFWENLKIPVFKSVFFG
jgi:hypothetical protein